MDNLRVQEGKIAQAKSKKNKFNIFDGLILFCSVGDTLHFSADPYPTRFFSDFKGSDQRENRGVWSNINTRYLVWRCGDGRSFVL